ncbi:MAG: hypothetical protein GM46_4610 [actinobacterium acAcidi]|jgi:hypothetical protein|nr:MAG: hypothetical protein GM46_4610 [actinobacterium acAcidi]
MTPSATTKFTAAARVLAQRAAELDLVVPGFRSPPRIVGVNRSIRRSRDSEGGVVAVRLSDRPFTAAVGDMIEGVIFINRLEPPEADRARTQLWRTMLQFTVEISNEVSNSPYALQHDHATTRVA